MEFYASFVVILVTYLCMCLRTSCGRPPNIVFVLTDDQDVEIGGMVSTSLMPVIAWKCLYWERWVRAAGSQLALPTVFMPRWLHSSITPSLFYSWLKTHIRLTALFPGLPRWAGTRKVKPIWILLKQEAVNVSGISWAICKSAPRSRQITMPAPTTLFFTGRMPFLPPNLLRLKTFSANPSCHSLLFLLHDWLHGFHRLITYTAEHIRFLLFIFCPLFTFVPCSRLSWLMSAIERTLK